MIDVNKMCQHTSSLLNSDNATMQRYIDNAHRKGQLSSSLDIPQLRQLKPSSSRWPWLAYCEWKSGRYTGQTVFSCRQTWLKPRWSSPKRKMTIKNTQSLRILMASGLRLTYMSKLDMHSVSLKVRDIQVWQPSMAPALVSLAGKNTPSYNDKQ